MSTIEWVALGAGYLTILLLLVARAHLFLHLLQQEHYELGRLQVWVARRGERFGAVDAGLVVVAADLVAVAFLLNLGAAALALGLLALAAASFRARAVLTRSQIKPLVFTSRARRLLAFTVLLAALCAGSAFVVAALTSPAAGALVLGILGLALLVFMPELLGLANLLLGPVQKMDNARFERRARRKLREIEPLVIGITGSYGKTTTKGCVAQVADLLGPTLPTPASFNSYLGVVRTINENLRANHRNFVVEMGAYRRGDIAELCQLVEPRIGILTAIGPAHLERFGSLEETTLAKGELGEALPVGGTFVTRADDERCRQAAERTPATVRLFAPEPHPDAAAWAEGLQLRDGRTHFQLCLRSGSETARAAVKARLLGKHNVANLVAAALVGAELGLAPDQIARALGQVSPPEHRLSTIVNRAAGIVVIDDAYNSNPSGAQAALEVLATHPGERRVLVTPGMVELGNQQDTENERFGAAAAEVCDVVVLVGEEQTAAVRRGLERGGFAADSVRVVADSAGAQELLAESSRAGDVILFENDLPDLYQRRTPAIVQP